MNLAPIVLFVYNRPIHTRRTLDALAQNEGADESSLFIYCDGPKTGLTQEAKKNIDEVRQLARQETRFKHVKIIEQDINQGLAKSVLSGVTEILNQYNKVIVLEDDLITDRYFLSFMNQALNLYENDLDVACISGYIYPVKPTLPESFFLKGADCWGWAAWKRSWDILEPDGEKLLAQLLKRKAEADFNFNNTYPYIQMLRDQIAKKNNSWAILWYASAYLENKYTLYPAYSLVHNIGIDGSGTHSGTSQQFDVEILNRKIVLKKITIEENLKAKKIVAGYFANLLGTGKNSILDKFINKLRLR